MPSNQSKVNKVIIGTFVALLSWPAIGYMIPTDQSTTDRRALAQWPTLQDGNLKQLAQDIEAYTSDQFMGRGVLLKAREAVLRSAKISGNKKVILGDEGWMYLLRYQGLAEYSEAFYSAVDEQQWLVDVLNRQQEYSKRGAQYFYVVAPNKQGIYPEFLPIWAGRRPPRTRWEEIQSRLGDQIPDFVIDLSEFLRTLRAACPDQLVFFKTDAHWNSAGGSIAAMYVVDRIQGHVRDIAYYVDHLTSTIDGSLRQGDLVPLCGVNPGLEADRVVPAVLENTDWWSVAVPAFDESIVSIDKNCWRGLMTTVNPTKKGKLLIDRDSFCEAMLPVFSSNYQQVTSVLHKASHGPIFFHLADSLAPDIVIEEHVEDGVVELFPPSYTVAGATGDFLGLAFGKDVLKQPLGLQIQLEQINSAAKEQGSYQISSQKGKRAAGKTFTGWALKDGEVAKAVVLFKGCKALAVDRADSDAGTQPHRCGFAIDLPDAMLDAIEGDVAIVAVFEDGVLQLPCDSRT